jgi:hypothetical protein
MGVVVPMDVGDEDTTDVGGLVADGPQRELQCRPGLRDPPSSVDKRHTVVLLQRVDVDRTEAIAGKG